jgi:RNA polymerase sigma-70 factor (ECF subfamily)
MVTAFPTVARRRQSGHVRFVRAFADARSELTLTLCSILGSPDDAQDAVQEAFLKCWRRRRQIHGVRNLRAWIFRVGLNTARDFQRNVWRRRWRPLAEQPEQAGRPGMSPSEEVESGEDLDRLRAALAALRPEERAVFLLRQNTGLTYDEIAARRRQPVGTVKTQMRAAVHKLHSVLRDRD